MQEEIKFNHIEFTDNTLCLELLEKPPRCVLRLLSEQCHLPRGCDASYISNLHADFENHERYVKGNCQFPPLFSYFNYMLITDLVRIL